MTGFATPGFQLPWRAPGGGRSSTPGQDRSRFFQHFLLLLRLHALRHHFEPHLPGHGQGRPHDLHVVAAGQHVAHEFAVDLEAAEREPLEGQEGRIAGPEVIDGEKHPVRAQLIEVGARLVARREHALGHLDFEPFRGDAVGAQCLEHLPREARVAELVDRDVDRHVVHLVAGAVPFADLADRFVDHPSSDFGIRPWVSAISMNSPGATNPLSGWRQRISASKPTAAPDSSRICGW